MKKILIIEDDDIVASIYRNKFVAEGYQCEVAVDGQAGWEMLGTYHPDIVLVDLVLPKLSGTELIKKIRASERLSKLPVIVFSNTYLTNMVQEAWRAGATRCLSKASCTPRQVMEAVKGLSVHEPPPSEEPKAEAETKEVMESPKDVDTAFQNDLRKSFVESLPATLSILRSILKGVIKADKEEERTKQLQELYRRIHALTGNSGITGMTMIAQMSDALEALLKELIEKPASVNPSTLRTVTSSVDFLGVLFEQANVPGTNRKTVPKILVVDDEVISRRAVIYALEKAKLECVNTEDPQQALKLLSDTKFDLVFLDVDMPNMNGFELCTKLRMLPLHKKTPVIFVTSMSDFDSRANSTMSGGNDLIGKPFLFIELTVKALLYLLKSRVGLNK